MWVQLVTCKQVEISGVPHNMQPGDWVEVPKGEARRWLAAGEATIPAQQVAELLPGGDVGVVLTQPKGPAVDMLGRTYGDVLQIHTGEPALPWAHTLIWDAQTPMRLDLIPVGFHLLETWQIAVPLKSYDLLACSVGNEKDREQTGAVLPDMRVPVYESGLLFVRRCPDTERLVEVWAAEPGDRDLAFLRALYQVKPLVLALPVIWTQGV